ncbi:hypothetical protein [Flavobacterium sp. J27]|uniref:hypothetical protein n=1 Tax=Flavobacterium sp. J27 TaxID=2060419 RepID=UPI0010313802|nr:hypothetical protein [Flavobacterium sp. J27]
MKNLFFGLMATVLFSVTGFANNGGDDNFNGKVKIATVENVNAQKVNSEMIINFKTDKDFENFTGEGLEIVTLCDVTVTVSVGVGSTYASATVTAKDIDCATLTDAIKRLKAQALAAIQ